MPANAMAAIEVDGALPAAELAPALVAVARGRAAGTAPASLGQAAPAPAPAIRIGDAPLTITCPDCGGVLAEEDEAGVARFRCRVGHVYSARSLLALHADGVERAMWTAARGLEDRAILLANLAGRERAGGHGGLATQFETHAGQARAESGAIRAAIAALDDEISADTLGDGPETA